MFLFIRRVKPDFMEVCIKFYDSIKFLAWQSPFFAYFPTILRLFGFQDVQTNLVTAWRRRCQSQGDRKAPPSISCNEVNPWTLPAGNGAYIPLEGGSPE